MTLMKYNGSNRNRRALGVGGFNLLWFGVLALNINLFKTGHRNLLHFSDEVEL